MTKAAVVASKGINWKDWLCLIIFGLLFAGNIAASTAEQVGANTVTVTVWVIFFWSLSPFVRAAMRKVKGKPTAWSYQVRDAKDQLVKSDGGYATQEAAIAAAKKQANILKDSDALAGSGVGTIVAVQDSETPTR